MQDRTYKYVTLFLVGSVLFFIFDVADDVLGRIREGVPTHMGDLTHLIFEVLSAIALLIAIKILVQRMLWLNAQNVENTRSLKFIRGEMEDFVGRKFDEWGLSPAERDIAMYMLKGLSIAEIAAARSTAEGTVKAQSSNIFRKTGVASRTELMSLFMDEFLDIGATLNAEETQGS